MTMAPAPSAPRPEPSLLRVDEHTVEIVSDPGEGAQKCGQIFGRVSAKMGNGVWTVEIIPAEIQPPARTPSSASGNRIRIGTKPITNWGDAANLVVAFNEQVLLHRHRLGALAKDAVILIENRWATHDDPDICKAWGDAMEEFGTASYRFIEVPMEEECLTVIDNPRRGKNMFALGMLARIYSRDLEKIRGLIAQEFRKKAPALYDQNVALLERGWRWAEEHLDFRIDVPAVESTRPMVVMNGNQALAIGAIASGMELCAMYPITPATMEECLLCMTTARRIAEAFRCVVIVLSDANLATGVQPFPRPEMSEAWLAQPPDLAPVREGVRPYDWDPQRGISTRVIPGQPGGMFTATGLSHDEWSHVGYTPDVHERGCQMRSRKLAVFQQMLKPPAVNGDPTGDLLVVGWGSTLGAIEEAVERARQVGLSVSSLHLRFLSPLEPGLKEIFQRFRKVMTVEINYSDDPNDPFVTPENRRRGQLCWLLRAQTLVDVDCWTRVPGEPLRPGQILQAIHESMPQGASR